MANVDVRCRNFATCGGTVTLDRQQTYDPRADASSDEARIVHKTCDCELSAPDEVAWLIERRLGWQK